jgi:RNA polymerase sigma-70 factor (ECF subfamily)
MTRQREASEDMLQNVFYRMLRSRHTFTGDGDFKTWMFYIARNVIKDLVKKGSRDPGFYGAAYLRSKGRSLKKNCQALGICKPSTLVTSALEIF